MEKKKTYCSICSAFCGLEAEVENNQIIALQGDKDHPMSKGFTCSKGRNYHHLISSENRVTQCQKRSADGWNPIEKSTALDEIAARIKAVVAEHGSESVAVFCGNGVTFKALTMPTVHGFMNGLGSHQVYSSLTIDQPAKIISIARHGIWAGGGHSFDSANVLMLLGNNVFVSGLHGPGSIPGWQPGALKEARARGLKLIVVDPRYTETAKQSDLYLPIRPGTDAAFLSGVINWILANNLHDGDFCEQFTEGLDALREQVAPYNLARTAELTGLEESLIREAAELFATSGRGTVGSATGPDMAPHANLSEHLIYSLNTLCGRHNRAGDKVSTSLLTPDFPPMEAVVPTDFLPEALNPNMNTKRSRLSGAHQIFKEMPTSTLADEILAPGKGQIKALLVIGGNPMLSIPEQDKTRRALESLELCVCIDGRASDTAEYADYLLPASYGLERTEMTVYNDLFWDKPFHQVSQPVVTPPGEATEEYRYLAALAQRLGTEITLPGGRLDVNNPPDALDALALLFPEGATKVSVGEIASHEVGKIYEEYRKVEVIPAMEGMDQKLQFVPEGVEEEFAMLAAWSDADSLPEGYSHLMICRRNPHVYNSMCHEFPSAPADNPAWLHPEDIDEAGLEAGQQIWIESAAGKVTARLDADKTLRRGVLALSHGFGGKSGTSAARLLSTATTTDRYTKIPQMTAVPVKLSACV